MPLLTLTCQCCGFRESFESTGAAFQAGWDFPPYFTGYVCCNLCPAVAIILPTNDQTRPMKEAHARQHLRWQREGRPDHFIPPEAEA